MQITIDDKSDGSLFDLDLRGGIPSLDSILVTEAPDGTDRRVYRVTDLQGTTVIVERQAISHGTMLASPPSSPPTRPPTATPVVAYGNNATVACGCGASVMVRSLGKVAEGAYKCDCGRYLKGFPDNGRRIEFIHVWEDGDHSDLGTYRVVVDRNVHQA